MKNGKRKCSLKAADGVVLPQQPAVSPYSLRGIGRGLASAYDGVVDATSQGIEIMAKPFSRPVGYTPAAAPVPVAAPEVPAAPVAPALPQLGGMNLDVIRRREAAAGLRDGTAFLEGPGGPTDDKIDAKLSRGEAVLPADTVQAVGPENIRALIDATHTPVKKKGLRHFANGIPGIDVYEPFNPAHRAAVPQPSIPGMEVREVPRGVVDPGPGNPNVNNMGPRRPPVASVAPAAPPAVPAAQPAPAAQAAKPRGYGAGRVVAKGLRTAGPLAVGAEVVDSFGENRLTDDGIDSSAAGTLRYLRDGDFSKAWDSQAKGAVEAGMDLATGAAKVGDIFLPGQPLQTGLRKRFETDLGDQLATDVAPRPAPAAATPAITNPTDSRLAAGTQTSPQASAPAASAVPGAPGTLRRGNSFTNTGEFIEDQRPGAGPSASDLAAVDRVAARSTQGLRAGLEQPNLPAGFGATIPGVNAPANQSELELAARNASVRSSFGDRDLSARQRMQRDAQERQDATQREMAGMRDATERRGQDITNEGFARRDRVTMRGQDLQFGASQARTAATVAEGQRQQRNADRQYKLDVEKFGVDVAEKNRAARSASDESFRKNIETRFRTPEGEVDSGKVAAFSTAVTATLPRMIEQLEDTGRPEAVAKARALRERGVAAMEPGDLDGIQRLFDIRERMRAARGMGPNQASFVESDNLLDYRQAGLERRAIGGDRVVTAGGGSVSENDLAYTEPANAVLPDWFKTRTNNLTRGLRLE